MKTETLKPCPFCGGKATLKRSESHRSGAYWHWCVCRRCRAYTETYGSRNFHPIIPEADAQIRAIKAWNRRTP